MPKPTLHILLPVLNEQARLESGLTRLATFLHEQQIPHILTIIDNGSTDSTPQIAKALVASQPNASYLRLEQRGVGLALQAGIDHSSKQPSEFLGYMDIDLSTRLAHLLQVYERLCAGAPIVVGSRLLGESRVLGRSLKRELLSRALNAIIKAALYTDFSDAMCGFKFYQAGIATLLRAKCSDDGSWFYCAQMLIQAQALGIAIEEIPIVWEDDSLGSKVQAMKLARIYLAEIARLRPLRHAILRHRQARASYV